MRQDSSFLYFFGQHRDGLVGVIDIDNDEEWLLGDDIDVEDIVWMGFTPSVADLASEVGIVKTAPMSQLKAIVNGQSASGRQVHFLPPYKIRHQDTDYGLAGHSSCQAERMRVNRTDSVSVVKMRSTKEVQEIEAIDRACDIGYAMHTTAQPAHQARGHGTFRRRTGRRHCTLIGKRSQLCHHFLPARRNHARRPV